MIAKTLSIGSALTTILIVSGSVTDPVNAPKLIVIGITGSVAFFVLFSGGVLKFIQINKIEVVVGSLFVISMSVAVFASDSPISQNIYGSYGRNNGFITYLFLVAIWISSLSLRASMSFVWIVKALLVAGIVNISYCLWAIVFGDFIGWTNPYGNILGTLGNPNFIGSFLGIFFTAYLAFALSKSAPRMLRYSLLLVLPITAFEIYESNAIQGRVVAALGIGILGFLLIRSQFDKLILFIYSLAALGLGALALLGTFQVGPLTKYIYKTSVSLRGQYWLAGWNTGESHPITGVGMDAFGDWYRRSRDVRALELPGVDTVVNAAHNVPMDMFAFGGWPLLITYVAIMCLAALAAIKLIIRKKDFDPLFAVLLTSWAGYQLQSIISINQIGLAVWGWLLSGCLIAYEKTTRNPILVDSSKNYPVSSKKQISSLQPGIILIATASTVFGLILSLPPFSSDAKWRSAQLSGSVDKVEASMAPSYFNPPNVNKYLINIQNLESSNLNSLAHKYAVEATEWNPESYDLWLILYLVKDSTEEEKALALKNLKRLDPLNPNLSSVK